MKKTNSFSNMNLSEETLRGLKDMGFSEATPIQAEAISLLLQGYDVIGQSQTGTGKTAAFSIPLVERIEELDRSLQAVVLCPTRELTIQVAGELRKLLKYHAGIRVVPIYGGQPIDKQIQSLRGGVQIIVATPGRFLDHLRRHTLRPKYVHTVVLDEADEMLDMGFREDIETILHAMPEERQTVLFSATLPEPIVQLAEAFLHDPKTVRTMPEELTLKATEEVYFDLKEKFKPEALARILEYDKPTLTLVFCNTKKRAADLCAMMEERGFEADALHGDLTQIQRDAVMNKFRRAKTGLLIATDVAARGIDVEHIDLVVNYDVPDQLEFYVHRIGRTGRAGASGRAYTFVVGREFEQLKAIMQYTGSSIRLGTLPTRADLISRRTEDLVSEIRRAIDTNAFEHQLDGCNRIITRLQSEGYAPEDVAAALFFRELSVDGLEELSAPPRLPETVYTKKDMIPVLINIGSRKKIRPKDVTGAITANTGIQSYTLGEIRIEKDQTVVEVPKPLVRDVVDLMNGATVKGYSVQVTKG